MAFIPGVQKKAIMLRGNSGLDMRDMTPEELVCSVMQADALEGFNNNIRIPFRIMIREKGGPFIRKVKDEEMTFGEDCTGNILLGRSFQYNSAGKQVKNNTFYSSQDVIEIDPAHITFFSRLKIAYQVFSSLKN